VDNNISSSSILSGFDLGPDNDSSARSGPPDLQLNWIHRFLHIKPASKVLCFQIGRGKVRQEFVRLLRDWQIFGVKDVTFDRQANTINARVDKNNREYTQLFFTHDFFAAIYNLIEPTKSSGIFYRSIVLNSSANQYLPPDLKVKPVSLVIELFVVLDHGRRANLCLARFTQTKGAASSFRKAVDIIEEVFQNKELLVEDEVRKAGMCEVLG
jgi:serine/threonine-protein kinase HSL1 (negative regulator of Swe1 kinase)